MMWNLCWFNIWKLSKPKFHQEIPLILAIVDEYVGKFDSIVFRNPKINLYALSLAVRKQENGPPGLEFGVMAAKGTDLEEQARWAVCTFIKNIQRWERTENDGTVESYIQFLGNRWAPIGAENDPNNLNQFWVGNVTELYNSYSK